MKKNVVAAIAAGFLLASCGASGGESGDRPPPTTTTTSAPASTTSAVVDDEFDGDAFQELIVGADRSVDYEAGVRDGFAEDGDVPGAAESAGDLRFALNLFDEQLRELEVPASLQTTMNEVLTANGTFIEVLDGYVGVTEVDQYNDQLDAEAEARSGWYEALNSAAEAFGTDGIESDFEASTDDGGAPTDEVIPAGEVAETGTASMEVPEGFEATAVAVIEMENGNGARIGLYTLDPDATTLPDVAQQSVENGADKDGYEITGGPEETTVGDYEAIAYYFDYGDGTVGRSLYFEAEDSAGARWHVLSLDADDTEIEEVSAALESVLDTVTIT
ncbi:MAG: hypothetical protein JWO77_949 [Ilumatobacteraceae bacterium]|nr:hypothetical protein [Ilumatobacteraceae bacterium]